MEQSGGDRSVGSVASGRPLEGVDLPFPCPRDCGDFAIRIRRDGAWLYQGSVIPRPELCRLFASALYRDAKQHYWLVTPIERGRIEVDVAPFFMTDCRWRAGVLRLCTSLGEWIEVGGSHPLRMRAVEGEPAPLPFVRVRDKLEGLLSRAVFYSILERAKEEGDAEGGAIVLSSGRYSCALRV